MTSSLFTPIHLTIEVLGTRFCLMKVIYKHCPVHFYILFNRSDLFALAVEVEPETRLFEHFCTWAPVKNRKWGWGNWWSGCCCCTIVMLNNEIKVMPLAACISWPLTCVFHRCYMHKLNHTLPLPHCTFVFCFKIQDSKYKVIHVNGCWYCF